MKELKEIAHRITQCDEVGVKGEEKKHEVGKQYLCQPSHVVYTSQTVAPMHRVF